MPDRDWTPEEELWLLNSFVTKHSLSELASMHIRTQGDVALCLVRANRIIFVHATRGCYRIDRRAWAIPASCGVVDPNQLALKFP
jgi:hypothetical protein